MLLKSAIFLLVAAGSQSLTAQTDGYWKFSARKEWKYAAQPGRTDARVGQNITLQSIEYTWEIFDTNNTQKWLKDNLTFQWDMMDSGNLLVSILPTTGNERLTPGQKVRAKASVTFIGQYYSNGSASVYVGEPPLQTPYGWKSATDLYPMWGYYTDAILYVQVGNNSTRTDTADFIVPKGSPTAGPLTIRFTTGIQGSAAVEYLYDWVAPAPPAITATTQSTTGQRSITSGSWFTVWGSNFTTKTRSWESTDFNGRQLPTSLEGVQVLVHGRAAPICFISPGQINALAPSDSFTGDVEIQVIAANGTKSQVYTVTLARYAPGFFLYQVAGAKYPVAHVGSEFIGKPGLVAGLVTRPVKSGEVITLYGTGFGPAAQPFTPETTVTGYSELASPVTFTIGGVPAAVAFAGQTGSGLNQFNIAIPEVPNGDMALVATIGGVSTPSGILLTVQN